jgi:hypothetical protein
MALSETLSIKNTYLLVFVLIFYSGSLSGQILNIEKSRIPEDSLKKLVGNIGANFSLNNRSATQNEKVLFIGLTGNMNIGYFAPKNAYLFFGAINYTSFTGAQTISTGYAHFRINFNRKKKLSTETFAQIQYDESRGMAYRALGGAGLRLNIHKTKNVDIYIGTGAMWETEEWSDPNKSDSVIVKSIPKSSSYFSFKANLNPNTTFNCINYYQVGYDEQQKVIRHRIFVDATLTFLITKHLSFINTFNAGYEDKPIVPIQKFVYTLSNGIIIKF